LSASLDARVRRALRGEAKNDLGGDLVEAFDAVVGVGDNQLAGWPVRLRQQFGGDALKLALGGS